MPRIANTLVVLLAVGAPLAALSEEAAPKTRPVVDVRIVDRAGRVLLTRDGQPLIAAQLRPVAGANTKILEVEAARALVAGRDAPPVIPAGSEQLRELNVPLPGLSARDVASVLLRARRIAAGVRLLVNSTLSGPAYDNLGPGENLPAPPAYELAVQFFPDADKSIPAPKEVNFQREVLADEKIECNARALVFETHKDNRLFVQRSGPANWQVQRLSDCTLLTAPLLPDPREPANFGSFLVYLGTGTDDAAPELSPVILDKTITPAHDFIEGAVRVYASGADPFVLASLAVVAEVACPPPPGGDVEIKRLPCFFWQAPANSAAEGEFRFRFAPPHPGTYGLRLAIVAPTGQVRTEAIAFEAGPAASSGPVRAQEGERVFRRDDGRGFVPLGIDLAGSGRKRSADYRAAFTVGVRANVNCVRINLSELDQAFEPRAGVYDASAAAMLDEILRAAQVRDIGVILALETGPGIAKFSAQHPYFRELNGPLAATPEFFRNAAAKKFFQNRLTYIAARYGAYRSVFAWELLRDVDEAWTPLKHNPDDKNLRMSEVDLCRRARRDVQDWADEMALHIKGMDQHGHLVCVSTTVAADAPWADLEALENLNFVMHGGSVAADADIAARLQNWNEMARQPGRAHKPFMLAQLNAPARADAAFAAISTGMAGVFFNSESEHARLPHTALRIFGDSVEWLLLREQKNELRLLNETVAGGVSLLGRVGRFGVAAWLHHPADVTVKDCRVRLPALSEGAYSIAWLDCQTGACIRSEAYKAPAKQVDKPLEPFELVAPEFKGGLLLLIGPAQ